MPNPWSSSSIPGRFVFINSIDFSTDYTEPAWFNRPDPNLGAKTTGLLQSLWDSSMTRNVFSSTVLCFANLPVATYAYSERSIFVVLLKGWTTWQKQKHIGNFLLQPGNLCSLWSLWWYEVVSTWIRGPSSTFFHCQKPRHILSPWFQAIDGKNCRTSPLSFCIVE